MNFLPRLLFSTFLVPNGVIKNSYFCSFSEQLVYSLFSDRLFSMLLQSNFALQRACILWDTQNSDSLPSFLKDCGRYGATPSASGSMPYAVTSQALICNIFIWEYISISWLNSSLGLNTGFRATKILFFNNFPIFSVFRMAQFLTI